MEKGEKKIFILYMTFVFLSNFSLLARFLSAFLTHIEFNLFTISTLYLVFQITKFIFEIPTGYISDKYGRKISAQLGIVLFIISYLLFLKHSLPLFYISFFLRGLSITLLSGSVESIYVESVNPDNLLKYNTIERLIFFISYALAALTAGYLIKLIKYNGVILIDIFVLSIVLGIVYLFNEPKNIKSESENKISFKKCLQLLYSNRILLYLLTLDFSTAFSFVAIENLYPAYLENLGLNASLIGIFISLQFICSSIYGLFVPRIKEHIDSRFLLYCLPVIRILLTVPIYIFNMPLLVIPALFILEYILFVSYAPIKYTLFQNNIPNEYRATIISVQSQAIALGAILFYGFSSMLSFLFSMNAIISFALGITFILTFICCFNLYKIKALK